MFGASSVPLSIERVGSLPRDACSTGLIGPAACARTGNRCILHPWPDSALHRYGTLAASAAASRSRLRAEFLQEERASRANPYSYSLVCPVSRTRRYQAAAS